ncbi:MAG: flagellar motor protein MotB [Proteobacteria bacterium]|nr:flagellar motor protein MotB [Pseudomonadota bacterium]
MAENNIIVKRIKKGRKEHHTGAWKIAYADFVTALMAFFLLMWLLETMTNYERQGIAEYFNTSIADAIKKGLSSEKSDATQSQGDSVRNETAVPVDLAAVKNQLEHIENDHLRSLKGRIEDEINSNPQLKQFEKQLLLDMTSEGLRIQIVDEQNRAMFEISQVELMPYTKIILREIGRTLNGVPNRIALSGHTDAAPFADGSTGYSNWELSTERANSARRELILGGMDNDKVLQVVGLADAVPIDKNDPLNAANRRISIVVMNSQTEEAIIHGSDGKSNLQDVLDLQKMLKSDIGTGQEKAAPDAAHEEPKTGGQEAKPAEDSDAGKQTDAPKPVGQPRLEGQNTGEKEGWLLWLSKKIGIHKP